MSQLKHILAAAAIIAAAPVAAAPVVVVVHGVASGKGAVLVSLCSRAEFMRHCALGKGVRAKRGDVSVAFPNAPAATLAVMAYHDENGNGRMDRTSIGISSEGYGFSRDATGNQGPPTFDDAAVVVPAQGRKLDVNLRY